MDGVEANYNEDLDEDNSSNTNQRKWPTQRKPSTDNGTAAADPTIAPVVDGDAAAVASASTTNSTASATPDTETEEIKEEEAEAEEPVASEDLSDVEPKDSPKANKVSSDDEDEEDEPPPKKQKHISALAPSPAEEGLGEELATPAAPSSAKGSKKSSGKKKKGKNNSVWTRPTSRKGKKRTKSTANSTAQTEDVVMITPIPRLPDKNDDAPDMKICLSKFYKAEKVELSEDRLTAGSCKGYRMVRSTRGVTEGAWYFEIKVEKLGETGHTRLGWSTEKGDLQAPVGYDGNSYGFRDIDGSKIHKALREKYAEGGYVEGDVIGFYINLPEGNLYAPKPLHLVVYKGQRYAYANDAKEEPPKVIPGSEISFFKNGIFQGVAFKDMYGGRYYPAASMYTLPNQPNCTVRFNFGPDFDVFPEDFGGRPVPKPMIEVPYHGVDGRIENGVSDEKKH